MNKITFSRLTDPQAIEILRHKSSQYQNLTYRYDDQTLNFLKKHFNHPDSLYLIAQQKETFAGFCSIDTDWREANYFFLREIFVAPAFQKQKIGEKLMQKCLNHARQKQATGVVTETAFENIPMQKLCQKLGFKKWPNPKWQEGLTYKLIFQ